MVCALGVAAEKADDDLPIDVTLECLAGIRFDEADVRFEDRFSEAGSEQISLGLTTLLEVSDGSRQSDRGVYRAGFGGAGGIVVNLPVSRRWVTRLEATAARNSSGSVTSAGTANAATSQMPSLAVCAGTADDITMAPTSNSSGVNWVIPQLSTAPVWNGGYEATCFRSGSRRDFIRRSGGCCASSDRKSEPETNSRSKTRLLGQIEGL